MRFCSIVTSNGEISASPPPPIDDDEDDEDVVVSSSSAAFSPSSSFVALVDTVVVINPRFILIRTFVAVFVVDRTRVGRDTHANGDATTFRSRIVVVAVVVVKLAAARMLENSLCLSRLGVTCQFLVLSNLYYTLQRFMSCRFVSIERRESRFAVDGGERFTRTPERIKLTSPGDAVSERFGVADDGGIGDETRKRDVLLWLEQLRRRLVR